MSKMSMHTVDRQIIERVLASSPDIDSDEHEAEPLSLEDAQMYMKLLPAREADILELCSLKKKQKEIASIFGITQGAVSHRIARANERLEFLKKMPKVEDSTLMTQLREVFSQLDAEVVFYMVRTTCQSKTAHILNEKWKGKHPRLTQVKVRHKFKRAVQILQDRKDEFPRYTTVATLAKYIDEKGLYMLHEVNLPHFFKGFEAQMDMTDTL